MILIHPISLIPEGLINRAQQRTQYHNHEVLDSDEDDNVDDEDDDLGSGEGQL